MQKIHLIVLLLVHLVELKTVPNTQAMYCSDCVEMTAVSTWAWGALDHQAASLGR